MKKIISILLAVIIAFSTVAIGASAYTMEGEGAWIGVDGDKAYINPGDTKAIPVSIAANIAADELKDNQGTAIDMATAVMTVPFSFETDAMSPIAGVELADAVKAAGATLTVDDTKTTDTFVDGTVTIPLSLIKGSNSIVVLNLTVKMDETWEVKDYHAINPVQVKVNEKHLKDGAVITDANQTKVVIGLIPADFTIDCVPYKPNFFERAIEWIKQKLTMIPVLIQTLNSYLLNDPLSEPKWVAGIREREERDKAEMEQQQQVEFDSVA